MGKLNLQSLALGALGAVVKGEVRMAHLAFSLLVIGTAAAAVQMSALRSVSFLAVAATFFAMWAAYSAAVAAISGRDGFGRALHKALFLDSLTYLPMFLPLIAKAAASVAGIDAGRYGPFGDIPVAMAFGIA
ncbi:hypothetical protein HYV85_06510, partial [Candidatus Woesearchaeota archaeon]|nr:hypothetical protein [Candidatus Woesearchaeota archaeon]